MVQATQVQLQVPVVDQGPQPLRIAVIGAGAGGSSAAFWINKAKERQDMNVEVHVFDKYDYVGGRSIVIHPYDDPSLGATELGASIFVRANKNLFRAVEEFGLNVTNLADEDDDMTIWDGDQYSGGWWDNIKMLWRYGYSSPTKTKALTQEMIDSLLRAYTPTIPIWPTIESLSEDLGFSSQTAQTGLEYFTSKGVGEAFVKEIVSAATRVNYAQNADALHGLEAAVSLAANGASQVTGGNYKIFEGFIKHSGAKLFLNTTITGLEKTQSHSGKSVWVLSSDSKIPSVNYDHVILAAPIGSSGITLQGSSAEFTPRVDYIRLHVTLLSTTSRTARPERFGLKPGTHVGRMILTNPNPNPNAQPQSEEKAVDPYAAYEAPPFNPACSGPGNVCARKVAEKPDFNSISYHRTIERNGREEHIWKVFSMEKKSDEWLEEVFGEGTLGWVYRKEWDSYPVLPPVTTFPPLKADDGLWYVNSMESWISTMETETLSSRNIVDNLLREAFGHGICPEGTTPDGWGNKIEDKKVYGWDC
ncbi:hypothetical protein FRB90_010689 [Tulasnella sp. 427]|nr:hypothetical protein FRB90_010689 [Tulasnella sp. 427]